MRQALLLVLLVQVLVLVPAGRADAACQRKDVAESAFGVIQVKTHIVCTGDSAPVTTVALPPRESGLDAVCVREALAVDLAPFSYCDEPVEPTQAEPVLTPGIVASAFRRLPLPAAALVIQPPKGRTLVNFETNFYTEQGEFTRTVRLLGREVELRIRPESFTWRYGDGESQRTSRPGAAYPDLEITHRYLKTGDVRPSLDVTYAADFRVGNGPWRPVAGTVTIPGDEHRLQVVEARPVLVSY